MIFKIVDDIVDFANEHGFTCEFRECKKEPRIDCKMVNPRTSVKKIYEIRLNELDVIESPAQISDAIIKDATDNLLEPNYIKTNKKEI